MSGASRERCQHACPAWIYCVIAVLASGCDSADERTFSGGTTSSVGTADFGRSVERGATSDDDSQRIERLELRAMSPRETRLELTTPQLNVAFSLRPHDELLADDAVVIRDGVRMAPQDAGIRLPYRGRVIGDPESWARFRFDDSGRVSGVFSVADEDEILFVTPDADRPGEFLLHRAAQPGSGSGLGTDPRAPVRCGVDTSHYDSSVVLDAARAGEIAECLEIDIALVSDFTHVARLGGSAESESEMLFRASIVDGLYGADLDYGFVVHEVVSFSNEGGPAFNESSAGDLPLEEFGAWKESEISERGLAHLFLARNDSGVVGLAWVGHTCHPSRGTSVSQYLGASPSTTVNVAHELGHNLGASHDSPGSVFIMAPSIVGSAEKFSEQSIASIRAHVQTSPCFRACDDGTTSGSDGDSSSNEETGAVDESTLGDASSGESMDATTLDADASDASSDETSMDDTEGSTDSGADATSADSSDSTTSSDVTTGSEADDGDPTTTDAEADDGDSGADATSADTGDSTTSSDATTGSEADDGDSTTTDTGADDGDPTTSDTVADDGDSMTTDTGADDGDPTTTDTEADSSATDSTDEDGDSTTADTESDSSGNGSTDDDGDSDPSESGIGESGGTSGTDTGSTSSTTSTTSASSSDTTAGSGGADTHGWTTTGPLLPGGSSGGVETGEQRGETGGEPQADEAPNYIFGCRSTAKSSRGVTAFTVSFAVLSKSLAALLGLRRRSSSRRTG